VADWVRADLALADDPQDLEDVLPCAEIQRGYLELARCIVCDVDHPWFVERTKRKS
jgi:hypothetical protein